MLKYRIRDFWRARKRELLICITGFVILAMAALFVLLPILGTPRYGREETDAAQQRYQFMYHQGSENFLYDFNYLMYTLEENWPFFNLSISANGVDVHAIAENMRRVLSNPENKDICVHAYMDLLREHFFWEIGSIGNLQVVWHYEDFFRSHATAERMVRVMNPSPRNAIISRRVHEGANAVMFYETLRDLGGSGLIHPREQRLIVNPPESSPIYETAILKEGRIAYIAVNRLMTSADDHCHGYRWSRYYDMLHDFHGQIEGFEHLVIDMRGSEGWTNFHFDIMVISPLFSEEIHFPGYAFYKGGELSRQLRENHTSQKWYWTYEPRRVAMEFVEPLPYLDLDFTYAYEVDYTFYPIDIYTGMQGVRNEVLFDGKIWVLTDGTTVAAAESAVAMFRLNDLATVVGEATYGALGNIVDPIRAEFALPNTGIMVRFDVAYFTDMYGRALQGYGIQPHHTNRPGMDALEIVLAMIEEMAE